MFCKVNSGQIAGMNGSMIQVEVDISDGLPSFEMVGYLASDVKEAQERVRTAFRNSGFLLPPKRVMINLSPANERKEGTFFDMAIAVAVLSAYGLLPKTEWRDWAFFGELGLDGTVRNLFGILALVLAAKEHGFTRCFVPSGNRIEASVVEGMEVIGISSLRELADILCGVKVAEIVRHSKEEIQKMIPCASEVDFADVKGETVMRRASEIAAAGHHNLLFIGPPGTGKTMIARRIGTILPTLSVEERIEISKVYSICGLLNEKMPFVSERPFRSPHHTVTQQALAGGGVIPKPGEISLAGKGVLFLDELAEFKRGTLDVLRQPLEERKISITRMHGAYEFPADMILVAATNPCPCGYYPDRNQCMCSDRQVRRYLGKISKPLLERIDIVVEARPIRYEEMFTQEKGESSEEIRIRVERARQVQRERFYGTLIACNGEMRTKDLRQYCQVEKNGQRFLEKLFQKQRFHVRNYEKIMKLARTIADLEKEEVILEAHIKEAAFYRMSANHYWGGEVL